MYRSPSLASPQRSSSSFFLSPRLVGLFLLLLAMLLRWVIVPGFVRMPARFEREITYVGEIVFPENFATGQNRFPLELTLATQGVQGQDGQLRVSQRVRFNPRIGESDYEIREALELLSDNTTIRNQYWTQLSRLFGTETVEKSLRVNPGTGRYIVPETAMAQQWAFPRGPAREQAFDFWEATTETALRLEFVEYDRSGRLAVAHYRAELGLYDIGNVALPRVEQRVRLDAEIVVDTTVARKTSQLVTTTINLRLLAQLGGVQIEVMRLELAPSEIDQTRLIGDATRGQLWLDLGTTWVPLLFGGAGVFLLFSGRRKKGRALARRKY